MKPSSDVLGACRPPAKSRFMQARINQIFETQHRLPPVTCRRTTANTVPDGRVSVARYFRELWA